MRGQRVRPQRGGKQRPQPGRSQWSKKCCAPGAGTEVRAWKRERVGAHSPGSLRSPSPPLPRRGGRLLPASVRWDPPLLQAQRLAVGRPPCSFTSGCMSCTWVAACGLPRIAPASARPARAWMHTDSEDPCTAETPSARRGSMIARIAPEHAFFQRASDSLPTNQIRGSPRFFTGSARKICYWCEHRGGAANA
jgi:hypothetical protein